MPKYPTNDRDYVTECDTLNFASKTEWDFFYSRHVVYNGVAIVGDFFRRWRSDYTAPQNK